MASPYEAELAALATGESIHALATYCETFELDLKHVDLSADVSLSIYKVHLAAYLLCNQLENARFLWKRVEPSMRDADPEFCALWAVGKAMWAKDHAATQSAITGFSWSPPLMGTLMERLQREHLKRCFDDSVAVYSMVSASSLSATLGVSVERIHELAYAAGWTTDAESGAYVPSATEQLKPRPEFAEMLTRLTDYVAHAERELK